VTTGAALIGQFGMQAFINSTSAIYVTDNSPAAEPSYHARFYFSPNGVTIPNGKSHDLFVGRSASGATIFRVQLRRSSGNYQVRAHVLTNGGSNKSTNWYTLSNASHPIEIAWQSSPSASFSLYMDGALKQTLTGMNTSAYLLETVRLGPASGISSGISGTEYYDAFASTRTTYIGP
jgi:hypothetical protein